MDIQFITNPYACLMYIVNYVSKGQRGMSNLLRRACEDAKKANSDIQSQVRAVGNKFFKHVEISAQEAVYITLQMKLKNSTCGHIFINTSPPEERPFIVKPIEELEKLPDSSTEIQCSNIIIRYSKRPKQITKMCLADFAAWYELKNTTKNFNKSEESSNADSSSDYETDEQEEEISHPKVIHYHSGIQLRRRRRKKIIRYVRYSKEKDPTNYYRELLLLFMPWRKEEQIICPFDSYEDKYRSVKSEVDANRQQYEQFKEDIDEAEKQIEQELDEEAFDEVAPVTQHIQQQDKSEKERHGNRDIGEDVHTEYDIGIDLNLPGSDVTEERMRNRMSDADFRSITRSLNREQTEFFYHVMKKVKTSKDQLMLFLSGGAGVGKTRLTKCLYQALVRYYNNLSGENPEQLSVLLTAPTGKAAYLIKGQTLHTAIHIPANQGFHYRPLHSDALNTIRHKMENLKLIIIDEISVCGANLFCFINQRMQEVMGLSKLFRGISVLTVGDLFQLKPVMDSWIFKQPSSTGTEILSTNVWKGMVEVFELTKIMRQRDDLEFANILNRIREGNQAKADIQFLKKRTIKTDNPDYPSQATHLLYCNKNVDMYNNKLFQNSPMDKDTIPCVDIVIGDVSQDVKDKIKAQSKDSEMGLSKVCALGVGLRCELTVNIDLVDGLVNGAGGTVKKLEYDNCKVFLVWIEFDDEDVGAGLRSEYQKRTKGIFRLWTPIKTRDQWPRSSLV